MILTTKHRWIYYRKFELDIWGLCRTDWRMSLINKNMWRVKRGIWGDDELLKASKSKFFKFFFNLYLRDDKARSFRKRRYIYKLDIVIPRRFKKKFNERYTSVRITKLYFLTFQHYQFRKLFRRASKMDGIWLQIIVIYWNAV
jgi:hypothetical protein